MDILIVNKDEEEAHRLKCLMGDFGQCEIALCETEFVELLLNNKLKHKFDCVFIEADFGEINAFKTLNNIRDSNEIILDEISFFVIVEARVTLSLLKFYEKNNFKFILSPKNEKDISACF